MAHKNFHDPYDKENTAECVPRQYMHDNLHAIICTEGEEEGPRPTAGIVGPLIVSCDGHMAMLECIPLILGVRGQAASQQ